MPVERFYTPSPLTPEENVVLEGTEFHHLARVTRVRPGETVELVNGKGCLAQCQVIRLEKMAAILKVQNSVQFPSPSQKIILAQAIPRMNRLDFIIEKGTELGMSAIWLFPGKLSERKGLTDHQCERLHSAAVSAMKQCGRLYVPEIILQPGIQDWKQLDPHTVMLFGDLEPTAPFLINALDKNENVIICIGPESGFTSDEIQKLRLLHAKGVKLHDNILRTDTAAILALSIITHLLSLQGKGSF